MRPRLFSNPSSKKSVVYLLAAFFGIALLPQLGETEVLPAALPDKQTFTELKAALDAFDPSGISESIKKEIAAARLLADRAELMLVAGRNGEAAAIAEELRLRIAILNVSVTVEKLRARLAADKASLREEEALLDALQARLVAAKQVNTTLDEGKE